jgi:hypothetical protein
MNGLVLLHQDDEDRCFRSEHENHGLGEIRLG